MSLATDIAAVMLVSVLAYCAEDLAIDNGLVPYAEVVRGASAVVAGALAAVGVVLARGGTLADLGFRRPKRWSWLLLRAAAILVSFVVMQFLVVFLVSLVVSLPEPDLSRYEALAGNPWAAVALALVLPFSASIPEEIVYRGFLMGRLSEWLGTDWRGASLSVLGQALFFGAVHFQWGLGGMIFTFIMGVIWGAAYLWCDRNLWPLILAHSAGHVLGALQLYMQTKIII